MTSKKKPNKKELKTKQLEQTEFNHSEIEKALFERAKGYEYSELILEKDEKSSQERIIKRTRKFAIPDVTACIFWLKNRLPDKWKDPKDIDDNKQTLKDFFEHYYDEE